jgi:hypothetical protein
MILSPFEFGVPVLAVPYRHVEATLDLSHINRNAWKVD